MAESNLSKNKEGYGYKYTDLAQIHNYLESINAKYIQQVKRIENDDYVMTKRCFGDKWEDEWLQGSKIVDAVLNGIKNPAQEQGSALTYARRYSLLMAFGLATEDDDGQSLTKGKSGNSKETNKVTEVEAKSIYAIMMKKGLNVEERLKNNYGITNTKDLTKEQYASILKAISSLPDKE